MSGGPEPIAAGAQGPAAGGSPLADGQWHRLHPLTPVFRGGLIVVVVLGLVVANLRERLVEWFLPPLAPGLSDGPDLPDGAVPRDPVDYVLSHGLVLVALLAVLGVALVLIGAFALSWRFHTFRITGDDVEVRRGVLFRTHRRAPLDRVQGVNLTRPMVARLAGMAKLEVVGAGLDANVPLEYLSTSSAEAVRADILRLAAGSRAARAPHPGDGREGMDAASAPLSRVGAAAAAVGDGITGIIHGAEEPAGEPESVVRIPPARLVAAQLLSDTTVFGVLVIVVVVVASLAWMPPLLLALVPTILAVAGVGVRRVVRSLRYSIAPMPHGVRVTFGVFTTVTETLPPGRVHAVEVGQPLLWRRAGWWTVTVNRLSGAASGQATREGSTRVLPVGTRADVERVVALLLPGLPADERALVFPRGILAGADDPYTTTPRRARALRPVSWRRNGFALRDRRLYLRRGRIRRSVAVFPLARAQGVGIHQGPLGRALAVVRVRVHTVAGRVSGEIGAIDREDGLRLFADAAARAALGTTEEAKT